MVEMVYSGLAWTTVQESACKGQTVQLLVYNDSFEDLTIDLSTFGLAPMVVSPIENQVIDWIAETGSYFLPDDRLFVVGEELVCAHWLGIDWVGIHWMNTCYLS